MRPIYLFTKLSLGHGAETGQVPSQGSLKKCYEATSAKLSLGYPDQGPVEGSLLTRCGVREVPLALRASRTPCERRLVQERRPTPNPDEELAPVGLVPSQILGLFAAETHLLLWVDTGFGCWSSSLPAQQGLGGGGTAPGTMGHGTPPYVCKWSMMKQACLLQVQGRTRGALS